MCQSNGPWCTSNLDYNALGQVKRIDLDNTVVITYAYYGDGDPWGSGPSFRLWRALTSRSGTALLDLQYGYDAVGNINHTLSPTANEDLWYTYDGQDRLTGVSGSVVARQSHEARREESLP